jgi:hypothetical protein
MLEFIYLATEGLLGFDLFVSTSLSILVSETELFLLDFAYNTFELKNSLSLCRDILEIS